MAITYRDSAADGSSSGTGDRSCAITPASGDLLLVFCCVAANTNDTPTCDDDNSDAGTYTRISCRPYISGGNNYRLSCFVRDKIMSNTDETTVTVATGSNTSGVIIVVAVAGSHRVGSSAVLQSNGQSSQSAGGTPAPAFSSSALTDNLTLTAVGNATTGAPVAAPTNWTERQWVSRTSNNVQMSVCTRGSGFTGTTITWGGSSATGFASHAIELDASVPTIAPSVISSSSTTQSPSVGGQVAPTAASTSSVAQEPAVGGGVSPDVIATTTTVPNDNEIEHAGISLDAAIDTTSTTQNPFVGGGVSLDVIATSSTAPQPTLSGFVSLDAVATTSTTQQPSVGGYLALSAISTTSVAQEHALVGYIETGATSTTLTVETHTLEAVIAPSATSTSSTTQSPSVDGVVTLSAVGTTSTTNDPSLGGGVSLDVIATTATIQTHLIAETVVRVHDATIDTAAASASATINTAPGRRSVSVGTGAASASATIETE